MHHSWFAFTLFALGAMGFYFPEGVHGGKLLSAASWITRSKKNKRSSLVDVAGNKVSYFQRLLEKFTSIPSSTTLDITGNNWNVEDVSLEENVMVCFTPLNKHQTVMHLSLSMNNVYDFHLSKVAMLSLDFGNSLPPGTRISLFSKPYASIRQTTVWENASSTMLLSPIYNYRAELVLTATSGFQEPVCLPGAQLILLKPYYKMFSMNTDTVKFDSELRPYVYGARNLAAVHVNKEIVVRSTRESVTELLDMSASFIAFSPLAVSFGPIGGSVKASLYAKLHPSCILQGFFVQTSDPNFLKPVQSATYTTRLQGENRYVKLKLTDTIAPNNVGDFFGILILVLQCDSEKIPHDMQCAKFKNIMIQN